LIYRLGELFCGPGGLALGAINAQVENIKVIHQWATDYHKETCDTYVKNIAPEAPSSVICKDIRDLDLTTLGPIDGFAYGFPCNDFSNVGEKKGFNGSFGPLYSYGVKVLDYYKPQFFVAENVGGLTSKTQEKAFNQIIEELSLAGDGYTLTIHMYKAEEYGIPQMRHRVILVGIDNKLNKKFQVPAPTHTTESFISCRQALENPPIPENAENHIFTSQSKTVIERLSHIKPGENAWSADLPEHLQLNVKKVRLSQIYRRMDPDRPAFTITGSGGGGTHGYHWKENRALSNRERARLQTFPDDFVFCGSKENVRRQIGMAVPPLLAKVVFEALLKTLHGIPYDTVSANLSRKEYTG
jgi:DNA (cytosine-5)-methyltransferase 1